MPPRGDLIPVTVKADSVRVKYMLEDWLDFLLNGSNCCVYYIVSVANTLCYYLDE